MANSVLTIGEIEENEGKCVWKIKNFSTIQTDPKTEATYYSTTFATPTPISNSPRLSWQYQMVLYVTKESKSYMSLYLLNKSQFDVRVLLKMYILSDKNEKLYKHRLQGTFCTGRGWGSGYFIERSFLTNHQPSMLIDDTLRISCKLTFLDSTFNVDSDDYFIKMNHFGNLFDSGTYSDVTLVIGTQKLQLHKAILAGLSPVFQAMFEHDTRKKKEITLDVTDIKYETMLEMFRYIYQRQVNDIKKNACDLLVAAEKYSVIGLKSLCEQTLSSCLTVDNAVDNLKLAITHNATYVKTRVTNYIIGHLKAFIDREDFKQMDSSFKDEILKAIVPKIDKKLDSFML